ncbi:hypothetical protein Tco_1279494 [Tanacetum coccineum]
MFLKVLQNELPSKEKDPGSFILPFIIDNMTVSNALADLGASISVMPFSLFKRLGLGNPKPIRILIEMVDKSMQSPKRIIENVLVKIDRFIFLVDFVILDIVEDEKVLSILGRPILATSHAQIDVFRKKTSLEVGGEKVIFNANEGILHYLFHLLESDMGIGLEDFSVNVEDLLDEQAPQFGKIEVSTTTGTTNDIASAHGYVKFYFTGISYGVVEKQGYAVAGYQYLNFNLFHLATA